MTTSSQSQYTLQSAYDDLLARGDLDPGWDLAGYTVRPILNIANKTFKNLCGGEGMFPWKWNQFNLPIFYFNSWQQDYALCNGNGGASLTNLAWLQEGIAIDINNPSMPKPWSRVETGRNQSRATGAYISNSAFVQPLCVATYLPNNLLYYGTWGAAQTGNGSWGNNPQPDQLIASPLGSNVSMPNNPILQIKDPNGNYLVLTTLGTTGSSTPAAASNAQPGTLVYDNTCVWTVVDPYGQGIRLSPVPSQTGTVWQINLVGQMKPTQFVGSSSLASQSLFPLTDEFYQYFLDGCAAECLLYSPNPKKRAEYGDQTRGAYGVWYRSVVQMRREQDREKEENRIRPARTILGAGGASQTGNLGPFWPFGYPVS